MNNLKITLDPYKKVNTVSLDGKPVSPYSELSNYIKQPFLNYAGSFLESAEREINDEFSVTVVAERFETMLLSALQQKLESCKSITAEPFQADFKVEKRFTVVASLAKKYGLPFSCEEYSLPTFIESSVPVNNEFLKQSEVSNARICIVSNKEICVNIAHNTVVLVVGQTSCAERVNGVYYWYINNQEIPYLIDAITDRFVKIPYITVTAEKLFALKTMSPEDRELLKLAISIEPLLKVSNIEKMEVGTCVEIEVQALPENASIPTIRAETEDESIAVTDGLKIKAISPGETTVKLFKSDEIIPFEKKKLTVFQDNTVRKITLDRPQPQMGIGKSQQIVLTIEPSNAEDAGYIVWSVDDVSIAEINNNGILIAKTEGRVTVTASTSKVQESVIVDILPNIRRMTASLTDVKLLKGETIPIEVCYEPQKCFNSNCTWITNDSNVALVETMADGKSYIRTVEPGKCVITCIAEDGGCSVSCDVEVLDPDREAEIRREVDDKKKRAVDLACIIGIPLAIVIIITIIGICLGCA